MDLSSYKSISINGTPMKKILIGGVVAWKKPVTNLVPLSTDTDGTIYNGVGYKDNVRLSSSGGISSSAQSGSTTTGFIPWGGDSDVLRMSGVEWVVESGKHYYVNFYDADKSFMAYFSVAESTGLTHISTVTRENGVTTIEWNTEYGTTNSLLQVVRSASYIRITAKGSGADMVVTINEEIT